MELPQEDQTHHGLPMIFSWAKEYIKIWEHTWLEHYNRFYFGPHVRPCSRIKILKYFVV